MILSHSLYFSNLTVAPRKCAHYHYVCYEVSKDKNTVSLFKCWAIADLFHHDFLKSMIFVFLQDMKCPLCCFDTRFSLSHYLEWKYIYLSAISSASEKAFQKYSLVKLVIKTEIFDILACIYFNLGLRKRESFALLVSVIENLLEWRQYSLDFFHHFLPCLF